MAQVIQDDFGLGSALGSGLGTGLGTALQSLAQNKLQNILTRQQASRIAPGLASLGIPQQEAQQIAMLPEALQSLVLKNYLQAAETAGLDQALQQLSGQELPPQNDIPLEVLASAPVQQPKNSLESMQEIAKSLQKKPYPAVKEQRSPQEPAPRSFSELLKSPRLTPEHRLKVAALQQQRQQHLEKLSAKEQQEVDKETKPYYDELAKHAKGAKESEIRLSRMEELINRGNLRGGFTSALVNALDKVGLDISSLEGADTQEFRKLSSDFIKNAKDFFGSRITDQDLKAFLKTIPNVTQSDEAKRRVINNLKSFDQISLLKKKAADDIIAQNGGKRPRNLEELVDKATSQQIDKIANDFKKRLDL